MIGKHPLDLLAQHSVRPLGLTSAPLQYVSAVLNCSTRLREVSAGCKRRAATRNSPKLKPERIRACCGESVPPNSEDLLDVVGIAESLDLNRQSGHVIAWVLHLD